MAGGRRGAKGPSTPSLALWGLAMLLLGAALGWGLSTVSCARKAEPARKERPEPAPRKPKRSRPSYEEPAPKEAPVKRAAPLEPPSDTPSVALVIDDLGYAPPELVRRLCALKIPFSAAVLPYLEFSRESATLVHEAGKEVLLHLPMEGGPDADPGPDALRLSQDEATVRALVRKALLEVPYRRGVNNHMGSRFTMDPKRMDWVLDELRRQKLFFLDSRTTKDTVAWERAQRMGVRSAQRQVFLDDDKSEAELRRQWDRALALARQEGQAIVIGHLYPETVEVLERWIPEVRGQVRFVKVSELVR